MKKPTIGLQQKGMALKIYSVVVLTDVRIVNDNIYQENSIRTQ